MIALNQLSIACEQYPVPLLCLGFTSFSFRELLLARPEVLALIRNARSNLNKA